MCFNRKYKEKGSIFQSAYNARVVEGDAHLNYLVFYILVKNVLEMYPGGLRKAIFNFDNAWEWAKAYKFSSLSGFIYGKHSPIIENASELLSDVMGQDDSFKDEAKELLILHMASRGEEFKEVMLESW